jgi:hypothetical protein
LPAEYDSKGNDEGVDISGLCDTEGKGAIRSERQSGAYDEKGGGANDVFRAGISAFAMSTFILNRFIV